MLKIYDILTIELKRIYEYDLYRKNMAAECVLVEEIITVVNDGVSGLRT